MAFDWQKWSARADTAGKIASVLFALWSGYMTYALGLYAGIPQEKTRAENQVLSPTTTPASSAATSPATQTSHLAAFANAEQPVELSPMQKMAVWTMENGNTWGLIGAVLGVSFVGCFAFWWFGQRRLRFLGEAFPCVKSLLRAVQATLKAPPFQCPEVKVILYKAHARKKLIAVAACPALGDEPKFKIDDLHPDAEHNQDLPVECWVSNLAMDRKRERRSYPYLCAAQHGWAKSLVTLPVIVSEEDPHPWGVLFILSQKYLREKECKDIIATLTAEGDILETLERLFERHRQGHVFSLGR